MKIYQAVTSPFAVRVRIAAHRTVSALSQLNTRQLSDIGLEAVDLHGVAYRMAQRSVR